MNLPPSRDMEHHFSAYEVAKAKVDKANADLRNVCKQADEAGIDLQAMKKASTMLKKDALISKVYFQQLGMFLDMNGYGVQIVTYDSKSGSDVDEAKRAGIACAEQGKFEENPYPEGTPPAAAFHEGYMSVQQKRVGKDRKKPNGNGEVWPDDRDVAAAAAGESEAESGEEDGAAGS